MWEVSNLKKDLTQELRRSIIAGDSEKAQRIANSLLKEGFDPLEAINTVVTSTAKEVGEKFERGDFFLTDLMFSAEAIQAANEVFLKKLKESKIERSINKKGKVVIATVAGDIHDIGKNIVKLLLNVNGFEVIDLGTDVSSLNIVDAALESKADIIALSALMTTTMRSQKEVIDLLKEMKVRDKFIVIVGGGSTTQEWAEEIGADGWAETAEKAVKVALKLVNEGE